VNDSPLSSSGYHGWDETRKRGAHRPGIFMRETLPDSDSEAKTDFTSITFRRRLNETNYNLEAYSILGTALRL
jgi:hypothetical protein